MRQYLRKCTVKLLLLLCKYGVTERAARWTLRRLWTTKTFRYTRPPQYKTDDEWRAALIAQIRDAMAKMQWIAPSTTPGERLFILTGGARDWADDLGWKKMDSPDAATFKDWTQYR